MADAEVFRSQKFRNYRPEYPPTHPRKHNAFYVTASKVDRAILRLKGAQSLHRAAFIAAAFEARAIFLDLMQIADRMPIPPTYQRWCGILNDDETIFEGGAKGPGFFHAASLKTLIERAGFVTVNTVGPDPMIYAASLVPLRDKNLNVLVIETTPEHGMAWLQYATMGRQDAPVSIIRDKEDPGEFARMMVAPTNEGSESLQ